MTSLMGEMITKLSATPHDSAGQAFPRLFFPDTPPQNAMAGARPARTMLVVGCLILLLHLAIFVLTAVLSHHPQAAPYAPDRIIDLMDIPDMTPPPQAKPQKPANPVPVPETQRMQVKDETKPAQPVASAEPAPVSGDDAGVTNYLPQSEIEIAPDINAKSYQARIVYPPVAQKMGIEAVVRLQLFIDQNGVIRQIVVLKDPGNGFAEAAIAALQGVKVKPAYAGGSPVAARWLYNLRFTLK